MFVFKSRTNSKIGHVTSKTRSLGKILQRITKRDLTESGRKREKRELTSEGGESERERKGERFKDGTEKVKGRVRGGKIWR